MDDKVFCSNCGKQISRTTKFCPYCGVANREYASSANSVEAAPSNNGTDVQQATMSQGSATQQQATKQTRKPHRHGKLTRGKLVALIVGLIVLIGAGVFGAKQYYGNRYDIYSMPHDYDAAPESYTLKFIPKTYIQINDHFINMVTVEVPSDNNNQIFLVSSRIPIHKKGSQLQLDYNDGQYLTKLYWPEQFASIQKGLPKNDKAEINLIKSLGVSDKSAAGATFKGKVETMGWSKNFKGQKNFNSRQQIVHYFYGTKHLRLLDIHKPSFDFDAAISSKKVKTMPNGAKFNQEVTRIENMHYLN